MKPDKPSYAIFYDLSYHFGPDRLMPEVFAFMYKKRLFIRGGLERSARILHEKLSREGKLCQKSQDIQDD